MADNKVNFLRGTSAEYETKTKDNDTFYYTTDTKKLYLGENEITGIEIDDTSTTATDKTWSAKKINDSIPTTLPANGGNADTLDGLHANEIANNPNLLINPDFKINQRGLTEYKGHSGYTVDMWKTANEETEVTLTDNGLKVKRSIPISRAQVYQNIENFADFRGKICTISANISELTAIAANLMVVFTSPGNMNHIVKDITSIGTISETFQVPNDITAMSIYLTGENGIEEADLANYTIFQWVKLELGSIATPFCPPNHATELLKIQAIDGTIPADTLDGKHASDFAQMRGDIDDCDNAIAFGTYNIIPETKNAPTANYYHLVVEPAANGAWIKQTAVLCDATAALVNPFIRVNINGTWSVWTSSCVHAVTTNHQMEHVLATATNILDWASTDDCPLNVNTKVRVYNSPTCPGGDGTNESVSDFIYDIFKIDNHDWMTVTAYDVRTNNVYVNSKINGTWLGWTNIADGGNAATVNGYTVNANVPAGFSPNNMMSKTNPTGTGSFSLNRKADTTIGDYSFAEGSETTASGNFSHAEGAETTASGIFSHAEGEGTTASAEDSHAEGQGTTASGNFSHAEGKGTIASALYAHSEGVNTFAIGQSSHAEGSNLEQNRYNEIVFENPRKVEIYDTATGDFIYITVAGSQAFGLNSHAEGCSTLAYGKNSHTEGYHTVAAVNESHAEGCGSEASGSFAHAEGFETKASGGNSSHAEGYRTTASGSSSHAEGYYTKASNYASHASGKYNAAMTTGGGTSNTTGTAFVIGNGTSSSALSNAFSVQYDGTVKAKSTITASTTADYAEFFEWLDGNPDDEDRVGYFVTLDGDKIRIATAADDYILGVVSGEPFVLGNGDCDTWNGMYLHDEFRRTIYEPAPKMIEILDSEGNPTGEYEEVEGEFEGTRPKLNPKYDHTQPYISRLDRKEWAPVGMLGVLAVRHDGTAQVNGYVTVNADGIATACEKSTENAYRVIKSNTDSVVEIIFR